EELVVADDALKKIGDDPAAVLERAISELEAVPEDGFTAAPLEAALRSAIIEAWASSPVWPSARCAAPSPGAGSHRRCSSRWSCWARARAWPGCAPCTHAWPRSRPGADPRARPG